MKKTSKTNYEIIASSMLKIYNYLKSKGDLDPSGHGTDFLHWKHYPMDNEQMQARRLMDDVIKLVTEQNSQLSELSIYNSLLFNLTQKALWFPHDHPNVENEYRELTNQLLKYNALSEVEIPIVNLEIEEPSVNFGLVTFVKIEASDRQGKFWGTVKHFAGEENTNHIYSFAKIKCPGDSVKSIDYAFSVISRTLNILRAVGLSLRPDPYSHFWLVNEYPLFQARTFQSKLINESFRLNYRPEILTRLGSGVAVCHLKSNILDSIDPLTFAQLQTLIENDFNDPSNEMKKKFFLSLHWLGEATKPDSDEAKFAKLAFSLEALIGGDASDKKGNLSTRGLTATLAERGAFIVASDSIERRRIHDQIYEFFSIRSGIVHGGPKTITNNQLSDFALLIRKITWALLTRLDEFNNIDDLQAWVLKQRYS